MMANSSSWVQSEILIAVRCLQEMPSSMMTSLVMGTAVRLSSLMLGARYPILLISSLEMSSLYCRSRYSSLESMISSKLC